MVTAGGIGRAAYLLYVRHFCKHCIYVPEIMPVMTFYELWWAIGFAVFLVGRRLRLTPVAFGRFVTSATTKA